MLQQKYFWKNFEKNENLTFTEWIRDEIKILLSDVDLPIKFYWDRNESVSSDYVVYQTEHLDLPEKLSDNYVNLLKQACQVYDYSEKNFEYFKGKFMPYLPSLETSYIEGNKEIEVLSYGLLTPRRIQKIEEIKKQYNVHHVDNLTLKNMADLISKSKWVLSIGSITNVRNDSLRITPCLNLGGNILLEETQEIWHNEYLKKNFSRRIKFL